MNTKLAIASLRAEIKTLAEQQRKDKHELSKPHDVAIDRYTSTCSSRLQSAASFRSSRITGYLNLLHELRGNPHCHVLVNKFERNTAEFYGKEMLKKLQSIYSEVAV